MIQVRIVGTWHICTTRIGAGCRVPGALPDGVTGGMYSLSVMSWGAIRWARSWSLLCAQAHPKEKLPALFLLDSIVKNAGGTFVAIFARNLSQVRAASRLLSP